MTTDSEISHDVQINPITAQEPIFTIFSSEENQSMNALPGEIDTIFHMRHTHNQEIVTFQVIRMRI